MVERVWCFGIEQMTFKLCGPGVMKMCNGRARQTCKKEKRLMADEKRVCVLRENERIIEHCVDMILSKRRLWRYAILHLVFLQ
jgi:hypothetical protein